MSVKKTLAMATLSGLVVFLLLSSVKLSARPATTAQTQPQASTAQSKTSSKRKVPAHRRLRRRTTRHVAVRRRTRKPVVHARRAAAHRAIRRRTLHRRVVRRAAHRRHYIRASRRRARYRRVSYTRRGRVYRHAIYRRHYWSPWDVSSYSDPELGDNPEGQVAAIRAAAVKALGRWNGSIVVVDPNTGRILALVNQKLALTRGYIPCSTVKPLVALAGLDQGVINLNTKLMGMHGYRVDMTEALAHSDNRFFAEVGGLLGYQRVKEYAEELGYGQRAGLDIPDESPGVFPSAPPPASDGGVGKMTSFGTGIDQTPLQMAALVSAIANGGTLYWLQYPRTPEEIAHFIPKVRRVLTNLKPYIPEVRQGMAAAVLYGTARLAYNSHEDIFGKTGTCSEDGGRMGWFISYSDLEHPKYVVIVELRGGEPMYGPHAAEIAGKLYRALLPGGVEEATTRHDNHSAVRRGGE